MWGIPETEVRVLPESMEGLDVIELGCGTGYVSSWLARRGARPVGVDVTPAQLETARAMQAALRARVSPSRGERGGGSASGRELRPGRLRVRSVHLGGSATPGYPRPPDCYDPEASSIFLVNGTLAILTAPEEERAARSRAPPPVLRNAPVRVARLERSVNFHLGYGDWIRLLRRSGFEVIDLVQLQAQADGSEHRYPGLPGPTLGAAVAVGGDLAGTQDVTAPILLASTSPQRRAILEQLGLPFDVIAPRYEERDDAGPRPSELVRAHAAGKARSVAGEAGGRPVLGVDTAVVVDGRVLGKPADADEAVEMLEALSGRTHVVVSGLCLLATGWEALEHEETSVAFKRLAAADVAAYVRSDEWRGRAGGYAIQGRGSALVDRIEGEYLNVVGLPAGLLVRLLAERFPGSYDVD